MQTQSLHLFTHRKTVTLLPKMIDCVIFWGKKNCKSYLNGNNENEPFSQSIISR